MYLEDKMLTCRECGAQFVFTAGEQEFYSSKGLLNEPARCPSCRAARKARAAEARPEPAHRTMYPVICAACGKPAEVPFMPRGDRPVYCSECYQRMRSERI